MESRQLVQDVNLHWSDLSKLNGSMNKLLYNAPETRGDDDDEDAKMGLQPLWRD